jgi:hypothetical protein
MAESLEVVGDLASAVLGARVSALSKVEWGTGESDAAVLTLVADKLKANMARVRRISRTGETENPENGAPHPITSHHLDERALDLGYSGYMELSMREINNNLQGRGIEQISTLFLDHNTLFQITQPVLANLVKLRCLYLSNNRFENVPSSLKLLTNLAVLDLSHNRLTRFPKEVIYMANLQDLDLSFNAICSIGRDATKNFPRLSSLRRLALHRNFLTQLPPVILSLTHLTYL